MVGTHADESTVTEGDERLNMGLDSLGTTELVGSLSQEFEAKGRCKDKRKVTKTEGQKPQIEGRRTKEKDAGRRPKEAGRRKK